MRANWLHVPEFPAAATPEVPRNGKQSATGSPEFGEPAPGPLVVGFGRSEPIRAGICVAALALILGSGAQLACASVGQTLATEFEFNDAKLREALENPVPAVTEFQSNLQDTQIVSRQVVDRDVATVRQLQEIVDRILIHTHKPRYRLTVRLIESPIANAFTTGGGYLYVFRGFLDQANSIDEVAGVLGHEIAHVDAGHVLRLQAMQLWTTLAALLAKAVTHGETADSIIASVSQSLPLGYSRDHEREADILGVVYATRAGFDASRMGGFFWRNWIRSQQERAQAEARLRYAGQRLQQAINQHNVAVQNFNANPTQYNYDYAQATSRQLQEENYNFSLARNEYLSAVQAVSPLASTHPSDPERVSTISAVSQYAEGRVSLASFPQASKISRTIRVLQAVEDRRLAKPTLESARESLAAGDLKSAEEALIRATTTDPTYGEAWHLLGRLRLAQRRYEGAVLALQNAVSIDPRSFRGQTELGRALYGIGNEEEALDQFEKALEIQEDSSLRLRVARLYLDLGRPKESARHFEELAHEAPTAPTYSELAHAYELAGDRRQAVEAYGEALKMETNSAVLAELKQSIERLRTK